MMKVFHDINEVVSSFYVDILLGCKGLWSRERFTSMCDGMGPYIYIVLVHIDWVMSYV